jgi:hypothetical protein
MYGTVPTIIPGDVKLADSVGECSRLRAAVSSFRAFATPKSRIFAFPSGVSTTFEGFKSR